MDDGDALHEAVQGLRLRRNEAQLTQFIAGVARTDETFAAELARLLVENAPERNNFSPAAGTGFSVPARLQCRAEERVWDTDAISQGFVDLLFTTPDGHFTLLVELKLHSGYGRDQVTRYLSGLEVYQRRARDGRAGLLSVTRNPPVYGEPEKRREGWLGSVRWGAIVDQLRGLHHADAGVDALWRTTLSLLQEQGDIGMTRIDRVAVEAWARYTEGRGQLETTLQEISQSVIEAIRETLGTVHGMPTGESLARLAHRGRSGDRVVFPHQGSVHLKVFIPAEVRRERLRVQFAAHGKQGALFSVEARHGDARRLPLDAQQNLRRIEEELRIGWGLKAVSDLTDHRRYWAHVRSLDEWLRDGGPDVIDRLLVFVREDVAALAASGIFSEENGLCMGAIAATEPTSDQDEDVEPL